MGYRVIPVVGKIVIGAETLSFYTLLFCDFFSSVGENNGFALIMISPTTGIV